MSSMEDESTAAKQSGQVPPDGAQRHERNKRPDPWRLIRALLLAGRIIWWIFYDE